MAKKQSYWSVTHSIPKWQILFFVLAFAVVSALALLQTDAAPKSGKGSTSNLSATLSIQPNPIKLDSREYTVSGCGYRPNEGVTISAFPISASDSTFSLSSFGGPADENGCINIVNPGIVLANTVGTYGLTSYQSELNTKNNRWQHTKLGETTYEVVR